MNVGEIRNRIAGSAPNSPVLIWDGFRYHEVEGQWQQMIHPSLERDLTIEEAKQGEPGITAFVVMPLERTAHQSDVVYPRLHSPETES